MPADHEPDFIRKFPAQDRAKQTVDTILDATAQILAAQGSRGLTTNRLAQKAGFSVGTLYQYFPNREAIVLALIERQRDAVEHRIRAVVADDSDETPEQAIRRIVRILHDAFSLHGRPEPRLVQALIRLTAARGLPSPSDTVAEAVVAVRARARATRPLNPSETFVLTRSVIETLRQAALHASPLLGTAEFEDALVRLVLGFLDAPAPVSRATSSNG